LTRLLRGSKADKPAKSAAGPFPDTDTDCYLSRSRA